MNELEQHLGSAPAVETDELVAALGELSRRADDAGLVDVAWATVDSPVGPLVAAATGKGLLTLSYQSAEATLPALAAHVSPRVLEAPARLDPVRRQLDEYFAGRRRHFEVPLDRSLSRGFRGLVLQVLEGVGYGEVVSYQSLAQAAGSPRAARAVGSAMATNPLPIVVPCHRVLRTGGDLGGYGGGLDAKRWLLRLEGALV